MYRVLFCCLVGVWFHPTESVETVFRGRAKPGLNDKPKLWWAKEVTPDYHISGRLSERQMKYVSDGGFKSILSLDVYDDKESGDFGGDYLPTTKESKDIVEKQCGIQFATVLSPGENWNNVNAVNKLADILPNMTKPVLLYSDRGYAITFVLLMHFANLTQQDPAFEPKVNSTIFYGTTAVMGFNFNTDIQKKIVSDITGEPIFKDPTVTNTQPENWNVYWLGHPVYKNWYSSGQITKSHMNVLAATGFKSVINVRSGLSYNDKPNQEQVNLINIKGRTGTYATGNTKPRQSKERLEETRVDPNKPNSYISPVSNTNYESKNEAEFGDDVGYNADFEKAAFKISKLEYNHLPKASAFPWEEYFDENLKEAVKIGKRGPVLVHCATANRASTLALLAAAVEHNLDFNWVQQKSRDLGFPITEEKTPDVFKAMKKVIDEMAEKAGKEEKAETNSARPNVVGPYSITMLSVYLSISLSVANQFMIR